MVRIGRIITGVVFCSLFLSFTQPVLAAVPTWNDCLDPTTGVATIQCLEVVFARILMVASGITLLAFFVMFSVAGFKFLTSGGDPKQTESAKSTMTWTFFGMIGVVGAFIVIQLISSFTGVDVGKIVIPTPGPNPTP